MLFWFELTIQKHYPFETIAICILPNHIHAIWRLPDGDTNYSVRWRMLKTYFSQNFQAAENRSVSKQKHHEKGIWHGQVVGQIGLLNNLTQNYTLTSQNQSKSYNISALARLVRLIYNVNLFFKNHLI